MLYSALLVLDAMAFCSAVEKLLVKNVPFRYVLILLFAQSLLLSSNALLGFLPAHRILSQSRSMVVPPKTVVFLSRTLYFTGFPP